MKALFLFFAALLAGLSFVASAASFTPLGFLPGGTYSNAFAVSNEGKVIAGQAEQNGVYQGFYWHADTGMVGLGGSTTGSGVSGDGSYIVGLRYFSSPAQAYTFSPGTGISTIGNGGANGVSSDGNVIVGNNGVTPARWSAGAGPTSLGSLPCSIPGQGGASAASTDGSIIIGDGVTCNGKEAFRWTAATGMVAIGDLPLGDGYVEANDVSGDGSVIVGDSSRAGGGREAFRWTSSGMVGLGTLPGGTGEFFSVASGVSADGNTIIGRSGTGNGFQVFIWTADGGMQNLNDVLISQGVDLQGYDLREAFGISDDGTKIVGIARNGDGYGEAFLVDLAVAPVPVQIDISPFNSANEVRPASNDAIIVAVHSTNLADGDALDFDATQVDPATLKFGGVGEASNVAETPWVLDLDGDADSEVMVAFRTGDAGIFCGDTEATLTGSTYSGELFSGTDSIITIDCPDLGCHP